MRTRTLLLSAVALATGIFSAQAQSNVYSANIVGYVNVVLPGGGKYALLSNPFDDGNGNNITNLLNTALPKQSQALLWNGAGYDVVQKGGTPANWPAGTTNVAPPGRGFFVRNGGPGSSAPDLTNTFVGSIVVPNGGSVTSSVPLSYTLLGSPVPYSGFLAVSNAPGGDTNVNFGLVLTKQSQILTWNPVAQGYNIAQKGGTPALWNQNALVKPGDGFFIKNQNGPATNVVETLNVQ